MTMDSFESMDEITPRLREIDARMTTGWTVYDPTTRDVRPATDDELFNTARLIDQPSIVLTADHAYITDGDTTHHIIPNFGTP